MPPPNVAWTPMLAESLGNDQAKINQLVSDFKAWKLKGGGDDDHKIFARDGGNRDEPAVRHVHLMPTSNRKERIKWINAYQNYSKRTSDIYLIYADGTPTYGYLLIDVLHDPGAHGIWKSSYKSTRSIWQVMADEFKFNGNVPAAIPAVYATTNNI